MTTKDQERKALEKIQKIVDDLGPDSYLAIAFEGCFDLARDNIENDWGCSWKQNSELFQQKFEAERENLKEAHGLVDELSAQNKKLEKRVDALSRLLVPTDDLYDAILVIREKVDNVKDSVRSAAETIVALAELPDSEVFKDAVKQHRTLKGLADYYANLERSLSQLHERLLKEV